MCANGSPEWCTHASVIDGHLTSFVACPSNDMLMTYENGTSETIGKRAEKWTRDLLDKLSKDPLHSASVSASDTFTNGNRGGDDQDSSQVGKRRLTGHFSFDFIVSTRNNELYPIECNARVHTAVILLPLSDIAGCYTLPSSKSSTGTSSTSDTSASSILRPLSGTRPRSWLYNDLIMRYLPRLIPSPRILGALHPSLPATILSASHHQNNVRPHENLLTMRIDPSLVADDPVPFLVLWHLYWPTLLLIGWWQGRSWTRVSLGLSIIKLRSFREIG